MPVRPTPFFFTRDLRPVRYTRPRSWREHVRRLGQLRLLHLSSRRLGRWGYMLMHRVLWSEERRTLRLNARQLKMWLAKSGLDGTSVENQVTSPQIPVTEMPIEPMAPTAVSFT